MVLLSRVVILLRLFIYPGANAVEHRVAPSTVNKHTQRGKHQPRGRDRRGVGGGACRSRGRKRNAPARLCAAPAQLERLSFRGAVALRRVRARDGGRGRRVGGSGAGAAGSHLARTGVRVGLGGPGSAGRPLPAVAALAAGEPARHPGGLAGLREHRHRPVLSAR